MSLKNKPIDTNYINISLNKNIKAIENKLLYKQIHISILCRTLMKYLHRIKNQTRLISYQEENTEIVI